MHDELLQRLEAATGPDRELDAAIAVAFGHIVKYDNADPCDTTPYYQPVADYSWQPVPKYTGSIDAALTLAPEWWAYGIGDRLSGAWAWVAPDDEKSWVAPEDLCNAPTPALAFCIAAIRARNAGEEG